MAKRGDKELLTREDWIGAALDVMAAGGAAAVAVDRLAKTLGASRGSFYWHFTDRRELIEAALARWEHDHTTALLPEVEAIADPRERLRVVFRMVYEQPVGPLEVTLAAHASDPLVAPAVGRVTQTRVALLRKIFTDLGFGERAAGDRAWLAYGFYIGHHLLGGPDDLGGIVDLLLSGE